MGEFDGGPPVSTHDRRKVGRHVHPLFYCREDVPLERFGFIRVLDFLSSIGDDPRSDPPEKVDHSTIQLFPDEQHGRYHARNGDGVSTADRLKISEHPRKLLVPVLGARREVQAVGPCQVGDDGVAPFQSAPEAEFAAFALEQGPAVGSGEVVQPFGFEGVVGGFEAVVVAHAVDDEIDLETRRLSGACGVERERLAQHPAARPSVLVGIPHHYQHDSHRCHEIALARGVGAVDHGRRHHRPLRRGGAGDQPLVPVLQGGRHERQFLKIADREMVGDAEAQQHREFPAFPALEQPRNDRSRRNLAYSRIKARAFPYEGPAFSAMTSQVTSSKFSGPSGRSDALARVAARSWPRRRCSAVPKVTAMSRRAAARSPS